MVPAPNFPYESIELRVVRTLLAALVSELGGEIDISDVQYEDVNGPDVELTWWRDPGTQRTLIRVRKR